MFRAKPWRLGGWAAGSLLAAGLPGCMPANADVAQPVPQAVPVVLLHGLARSANSMGTLEQALKREGYKVCNIAYPSREHDIATLARDHVAPAIKECTGSLTTPVHFVTHSMGGILARELAATGQVPGIRRVVMLAPPNHGSELVDEFGGLKAFGGVGGPASTELGTGIGSTPGRLGAADFELGIIAGSRSLNPLLSLRIPGPDDGKVSVESARLEGARDFLILEVSHPIILHDRQAIAETLAFLQLGRFLHGAG